MSQSPLVSPPCLQSGTPSYFIFLSAVEVWKCSDTELHHCHLATFAVFPK